MKQKILTYLDSDRGFASGKQLYATAPGRSLAFNNALNRMNDTPANCEKLHYELAKVAGITERHLGIILRNPVAEVKERGIEITNTSENTIKVEKPTFEKGIKGLAAIKEFAKEKGIEVEGKKRADFDLAVDAWFEANVVELGKALMKNETTVKFINSDELDKQSVKLHDQFPFLEEDDCPDVYKILVADMVTAYRKYKAAHPRLFDELTADERLEAVKAIVVPYKENKLIWDELEHYQANRKPLGKHPLLISAQRTADIVAMKTPELVKLQANLVNNINRNKKKLETLEGVKAIEKTALITDQETELHIVDTELKQR